MNYENRFVIFIDILGFKEKILNTIDEEGNDVLTSIDSITNAMKMTPVLFNEEDVEKNYFTKSRRVTQFSDSIVVSFEIEELDHVAQAIINTRLLILELIYKGFLCRGGIAFGKMVHTKDYLFGPALVNAYELENKVAIYPRVIINEHTLMRTLSEYAAKKNSLNQSDTIDFQEILNFFDKDFDGHYYLDYIIDTGSDIDEGLYEKYYSNIELLIKEGLMANNQSEKTKYYWMREKYNRFVRNAKSIRTQKLLKAAKNKKMIEFCKGLKEL